MTNQVASEPQGEAELRQPSCQPTSALDDETLVQVLIENYARSFMYPHSEPIHSRVAECKVEVLARLARSARPAEAYRAEFLWQSEFAEGSIEEAGYEFANGMTPDYQKQWWNILVERIKGYQKCS
jgi:hypothetical protein